MAPWNKLLARWVLAGAVAAASVTAPPSAAQEDPSYPFSDVVEVELVNVEVWVTDRKGRPIRGLAAENFEVLEDGVPVEVTHFSAVRGSSRTGAATPAPLPEPDARPESPSSSPETDEGGYMVIYFDELHLGLPGRKRMIEDVTRFIATASVPPERMMILRQTSGLFTEAPFGSTRDEIEAALEGLADREGLSFLAVETGGRAVFNRNRFVGELEDISRDMSNYYSLAYVPPHGGDRGEHRIKVRVKREKVEVRHRRGYRDKGPDERMAERLESALYLGLTANPLEARLGAGDLREAGKGKYGLPLHVMVPADKVVFLPQDGRHLARLKMQVVARTDGNRIVGFEQKLYVAERPGTRDVLAFVVDLELGKGAHVVAVGVRDEASQETSYVVTSLAVGADGDSDSRS